MRSFLVPILSAFILSSFPYSHAFQGPGSAGGLPFHVRRNSFVQLQRDDLSCANSGPTLPSSSSSALEKSVKSSLAAASILLGAATSAFAVSGGGLDYAGLDISGQDFSNGDYKGKDFTQVLAKGTNFAKSNLQGCRFYNSFLTNANYEGADIRGVSFERANLENVNLRNVNAVGAYFDKSLSEVQTLEGGDFTDAQMPDKTLLIICEREDTKGTNPVTGVDTRDSLMCL
mmetsp:Transcript_34782/g.74072  ORF Transcript_34782/g.74072 Transcript_34782/m.74072 type:complete len:230 (+) Transcript_34782:78-767(+)|eukprot:CAMPEP_0172550792 /NCGR_PEP_ID=MMETSP1067-20121228/33336_1 /TAXON_ID=265564 ORGANISM="Thalassiosira punctigera, Strain Tpunct2005C2" /NCGR_SAMPLE_ID=MMETSP1067 /ASSEMBLY_ACC=CAM_ASM_000444 /LENGTH=229 /DNA_ID=CAMNT_0013338457 /DNA_START=35 /DNA_END=724 /DNA_ORIENTATION=-